MSEFESEVKKAEQELEQGLMPIVPERTDAQGGLLDDEFFWEI